MDVDPELDVTLSNGRRLVTFQIAALDRDLGTWTVAEPVVPRRVILGDAEALDARRRLDARIAARLAAGWLPVDPRPTGTPARPLPADLQLYLRSLFEAVASARDALRAADPSGQLWAACVAFQQQAQHAGVPAPETRLARAQRERRLGERAEQAGDWRGAILHYRAAFATHRGVGVRRRLAQLEAREIGRAAPQPIRPAVVSQAGQPDARLPRTARARPSVQLACRIDRALHTRLRAQATRTGQTVRAVVVRATERALIRQPTRVR
jgi:hypothetical protein